MKIVNEQGKTVGPDDPNRTLWYSARCGYWTDDWSLLKLLGPGIPCCPACQCPGMQTTAGKWESGAKDYDKAHPGYLTFLNSHKSHCFGRGGLMQAFGEFKPPARPDTPEGG